MEMTPGWKAKSLAGNDKGKVYVIAEDRGEYVFLLDEGGKTFRKNKKHIQVIKKKDAAVPQRQAAADGRELHIAQEVKGTYV